MPEASDKFGIFYQNLEDAGCDAKTTQKCMMLFQVGNLRGMLPILSDHRKGLLSTVRAGQKKIDCLDYLLYQIEKETI